MYLGILLPFIGTMLGAMLVFILKGEMNHKIKIILYGLASGIMMAASIFSLIIPSYEMSENEGVFAFLPTVLGFIVGIYIMILMDNMVERYFEENKIKNNDNNNKINIAIKNNILLFMAITIHNIPEGMAVGVSLLEQQGLISGLILSIGMAIQNIPEGAIVSIPLKNENMSKMKAFFIGTLSGIVEPIFAIITIFLSSHINGIMPYMFSFSAGCMIYVVIRELIPVFEEKNKNTLGIWNFSIGFLLMMILDVVLG